MKDYRFTLDKTSKKSFCPTCNKKTLVEYIDTVTNQPLPLPNGRCDREVECRHHENPYKNGYAIYILDLEKGFKPTTVNYVQQPRHITVKSERVYIPLSELRATLANYEQNTLINNLLYNIAYPFEVQDVQRVIELYRLGTIPNGFNADGYMNGAIVFPFIDKHDRICAAQVKTFDADNHTINTSSLTALLAKRYQSNKQPLPEWLDKYQNQSEKFTCLYGEHLIEQYPNNPIALVEAPKTAVGCTLIYGHPKDSPDNYLFLSTYNFSGFTLDRCKTLEGRRITAFPDLSIDGKCYLKWVEQSELISKSLRATVIKVSKWLEFSPNITDADRESGLDLFDVIIKHDWRQYRSAESLQPLVTVAPDAIQPDTTPLPILELSSHIVEVNEMVNDLEFTPNEPEPLAPLQPNNPVQPAKIVSEPKVSELLFEVEQVNKLDEYGNIVKSYGVPNNPVQPANITGEPLYLSAITRHINPPKHYPNSFRVPTQEEQIWLDQYSSYYLPDGNLKEFRITFEAAYFGNVPELWAWREVIWHNINANYKRVNQLTGYENDIDLPPAIMFAYNSFYTSGSKYYQHYSTPVEGQRVG